MNNRNSYSSIPNQSNYTYDSDSRSSGWRVPAFSSQNAWSRSYSRVNRRLLDDPTAAYSRTAASSTIDSYTLQQSSIRNSNNLRRQQLEALRQAVHNQPARTENNSRSSSSSSQANEEDEILKHLKKDTYNPVPKSTLLRSLSLYYRNKTPGNENSRKTQNLTDKEQEDDQRCSVCLEDFVPKETVMITPCKHMFHEECIVPWLKSKGQCPVCRFVIVKQVKTESSPTNGSVLSGDMTMNDLFTLELLSVFRTMEETYFRYPR